MRDANTTVMPSGGCAPSADRVARAAGDPTAWTSSKTSTTRPSGALAVASSTARAIDRSRNPGSSWRPSSVTHANGRGSRAHHSHSSVVFPYPAGAIRIANGGPVRGAECLDQARTAHRPAQARRARGVVAERVVDPLPRIRAGWRFNQGGHRAVSIPAASGPGQGRAQVDVGGAYTPTRGGAATATGGPSASPSCMRSSIRLPSAAAAISTAEMTNSQVTMPKANPISP